MSLPFSDTSTFKGIIQEIERNLDMSQGDISGDSALLKHFTALVNLTLDDFTDLAIKSSGRWQFDDSNQTDYPIIMTNLVSGQRDYSFTTDATGNLILDIYRVFAKNSASGVYEEIFPIDAQSDADTVGFTDGQNLTGVPYHYDKTANGIFLDPVPSYSATSGLKVYINRESTYFTTADTTKKPGVPGDLHEYFALKPAYKYSRNKRQANTASLANDVERMEKRIMDYYTVRAKDDRSVLKGKPFLFM